ncbi:MAG: D-alanyl-D-alanine carboxypeptidase/D-alanyl-D-alanine-endopeptidase [Betaproteobacteria bacterium]|nr:D-alanyl-D-alanine carboxypeptidase/D-alanyl-D-alanine-endopeptidase [Betaproteobacteria bacterium]
MRRCIAGAMLVLAHLTAWAQLPGTVLQGLRDAGIPAGNVSAIVQRAGSDVPVLAYRTEVPVNPASVMKLVTTYAALELLGPAYRWKTEVYQAGETLYLRGTGDPKLNYESFWMLLRALRGRGLKDLRGDIVLDRSFFGPVADGRIDDEAFRPYNVTPDALLVNFKSLRFTFLPDSTSVRIYAEPGLPGLELVNGLKLANGACPDGRAFRDLIGAQFQSQPPRAAFMGAYPLSCGEKELNVALHTPADYVEGMIRQLWSELGGKWEDGNGRPGRVREGTVPPGATLLYAHESEPLAEIVRDINKFSNNVMARQLFLTLAAELGGPPARPENAMQAIRQWLSRKGLSIPELAMENGSGLSRNERISVRSLAALLQAAWKSQVMPEFIASLPIVAADGTMKKRLQSEPVAGQAHIKTGLLHDARAVAGYVLDRNGNREIVAMVINDPRAPEGQAALDALVEWAYSQPPIAPAPTKARPRGALPRHP